MRGCSLLDRIHRFLYRINLRFYLFYLQASVYNAVPLIVVNRERDHIVKKREPICKILLMKQCGTIGNGRSLTAYLIFSQMKKMTKLTMSETYAIEKGLLLSLGITPYYSQHVEHPALRKTIIPQEMECRLNPGEWADPLGEEAHRTTPHLIHTYPDKVLFLATPCSTYCRYCTRSRMVGKPQAYRSTEETYTYIEQHSEIRDVLISGGDPLTLSDAALEEILLRLRRIPHVKYTNWFKSSCGAADANYTCTREAVKAVSGLAESTFYS